MTDDVDPLDELAEPEDLVGKDELDEDDEMELRGADLVEGRGDAEHPPAS